MVRSGNGPYIACFRTTNWTTRNCIHCGFGNAFTLPCPLIFGIKFALINSSMRSRGVVLFCALVLGVCVSGWTTVKKPSRFVLGINAGLGRWTNQVIRDVLLYSLPSFPEDYGMAVADTDTKINSQFGFNLKYNFSPKFGLQAEFSRINAEYLFLIVLNHKYGFQQSRYDSVNLPWKVTTVYFNGVYNFQRTKGKVFPFAFAGVGFNILQKNSTSGVYVEIESKSSVDFGIKGGGGLGFYPKGAPLGFELRAFILYLTSVGVTSYSYQSYTSPTPAFSGENLVWAVDIGLKYRF